MVLGIRTAAAGLLAASLCAARAAVADAFVDPLDRPAERSALAPRRLLTAVAVAGPRLVAVGQRGHVLWSDDGGRSWTQAAVPVSTDLTALHFISPEQGWAVGHAGVVLATRDGGRTWARQLDGRALRAQLAAHAASLRGAPPWAAAQLAALAAPDADRSLLDVWFDDARTGFAVGAFNLVLRTDDGGERWTPWVERAENPRGLHLHAVRRVAGALLVVGEQGLVLRLDAARGRLVALPTAYAGSFFGVTGAGGGVLVFGLRGTALRSDDRGATWRAAPTGVDVAITGAATLPDGRLALVSHSGDVLVSADGGASFRRAVAARAGPAAALAPAGDGAVVVAGPAGIRRVPLEARVAGALP